MIGIFIALGAGLVATFPSASSKVSEASGTYELLICKSTCSFSDHKSAFAKGVVEHRGKGYSKALMAAVIAHDQLQELRRFTLATADAHELYTQYGFTAPLYPQSLMERYFPGIYAVAS